MLTMEPSSGPIVSCLRPRVGGVGRCAIGIGVNCEAGALALPRRIGDASKGLFKTVAGGCFAHGHLVTSKSFWCSLSAPGEHPMDEDPVLIDKRDGYRVITLNRPQRLNAFNEPMQKALVAAVTDSEKDESCRALLLTGTGRAFSSGQDLSERINAAGDITIPGTRWSSITTPLVRKIRALPFR